jgi:hypothetical protein
LRFTLVYAVTDCAVASSESNTVPVSVRRWWGEQATRAAVPAVRAGWPRDLADLVCNPTP